MANKKFQVPINLLNLASNPASASEGDIYYNTSDDTIRLYANGNWVNVGAAGPTNIHASAKLATTENITGTYTAGTIDQNGGYGIGATLTATATGRGTIDGVSITNGDRILVKNQSTSTQNGVYTVTNQGGTGVSFVLTRATDFDNSIANQVVLGDFLYVTNGTANATSNWILNSSGTAVGGAILIGTDAITFAQVGGVGPQGPTGPTGAGGALGYWGSFWSNQDQVAANTTTAYPITYNNTDPDSNGVSIVSNSRITFANAGVYNIEFSVQADRITGSGTDIIEIWFRKNGNNVSDSNGIVTVSGGAAAAKTIASWNYMLELEATDYVELVWRTSDTRLELIADAEGTSPTRPATPSVILTAHQVMYTQVGPTGPSGVVNVTSPITNSGTSTSAQLGFDDSTFQKKVTNVSDTEIGYLDGVTSAIQTQIDNKAPKDNPTFTGTVQLGTSATFVVEGATDNTFETTLTVTDPTADRTITFPDSTGTVALTSDITKSAVGLGNVQNIAVKYQADEPTSPSVGDIWVESDVDVPTDTYATLTSIQTLTNKTLTSPILNTPTLNSPTITGTITGAISGTSLTLSGDLTVNGTTTTINSTTLTVDDKNIELGSVGSPTNITADGGGITLKGDTDKTFNWLNATSAWTSSEHISLASGKNLLLNGTLGTAGQVLKVNSGGTALEWGTVSGGGGVTSIGGSTGALSATGTGSIVRAENPSITSVLDETPSLIVSGRTGFTQTANIFEARVTPSSTPKVIIDSNAIFYTQNVVGIATQGLYLDPGIGTDGLYIGTNTTTGNISIGVGGSSATPITIGKSTSTTTIEGISIKTGRQFQVITPVAINSSVLMTTANILSGMITSAGSGAVNAQLPTSSSFVTAIANAGGTAANGTCFDFTVTNTGSGTFTITTNTGSGTWTIVGSMAVPTNTSARFRTRKTSSTANTIYRIS
jgi:hypothetical protein